MAMSSEQAGPTRWVIWGEGDPIPHGFFDEEMADTESVRAVLDRDPGWRGLDDGWAVIVSATEDEVARWTAMNPSVRGYGPQLGSSNDRFENVKVEEPRPY